MSRQEQKHDQQKPDYKCDRCWSSRNINLFSKSALLGNDAQGFVVLCERCKEEVPQKITETEFENLFLRFASIKELLLYYDVSDEAEAIKKWNEEGGEGTTNNENDVNESSLLEVAFEGKKEDAPLGYRVENGEFDICINESEIIQEIYGKYLSGKTMEWIARNLSKKENVSGRIWSAGRVRTILKNPIYAGFELKGQEIVKSGHTAIIEKETFNKVQQKIIRNIRNPKYLYKPLILPD